MTRVALAFAVLAACQGPNRGTPDGDCATGCVDGEVCRYDACVEPPTRCAANADCAGDRYCDLTAMECLPWEIGPGGASDQGCRATPAPGVFFPTLQCEWT